MFSQIYRRLALQQAMIDVWIIFYQIYQIQSRMYQQLKQETLKLGNDIDKQLALCQQLANTPRKFITYQKTALPTINKDLAGFMSAQEIGREQRQAKCKQMIEQVDEMIIKRIKQRIQNKLQQENNNLKQQIGKMRGQQVSLEEALKVKTELITKNQQQIQRIKKECEQLREREEDRKTEEEELYHCKSEEEQNFFQQQELNQPKDRRVSLNSIIRKKSYESQNFLSKAICNKLVMPSEHIGQRQCHTERDQIETPHEVPTPDVKPQQEKRHQQNLEKSMSIQNNPDSEVNLSYQQLKEKYRQLCVQNQKMSEYLCMLHNLNHKWKKGSTEIQHHSKINVLGKISENLANLFHKDKTLTVENYESVMIELTTLIKDLQNYIHFLDHLLKIEPFQDHYRSPYHLKRLTKKFDPNLKLEKEMISKKTYSEGCSREDELIENFDIYPYQPDEIPIPQHEEPIIKDKEKKEFFQFQKFGAEENKQLFSEISSVKNQSQWSQISSFINSKSELQQLGKYLKNHRNFQEIDEHYALKKDSVDKTKIELKSFNELRQHCLKLKEQNEELLKQRGNYEKNHKKQMEKLQHEHTIKINKITKEFNESFGLLCQRSGLHKEKPGGLKSIQHKEVQAEPPQIQVMRKRSHSKTEIDETFHKIKLQALIDKATQQLQEQIKEKDEKNKELRSLVDKNKENLKELNQRVTEMEDTIDRLNLILTTNRKHQERAAAKINQDLSEFIKKVTQKSKREILHLQQQPLPERSRIFRKNSSSLNSNQYLIATKITEIKLKVEDVFDIISTELNIERQEMNEKISEKDLRKVLKAGIELTKRKSFKVFLAIIKEKLQVLLQANFDDWCQQFEQYRMDLEEYFDPSDQVSNIFAQLNELINKIRAESADEYGSLSINSHMVEEESNRWRNPQEEEEHNIMITSKQSEDDYRKKFDQARLNCEALKTHNDQLLREIEEKQQTISQLQQQISNKEVQLSSSIRFNPLEEVIKQKQKEIIGLQQEILALREQATKLKSKSKKPKIFHIQG